MRGGGGFPPPPVPTSLQTGLQSDQWNSQWTNILVPIALDGRSSILHTQQCKGNMNRQETMQGAYMYVCHTQHGVRTCSLNKHILGHVY